MTSEEYKFSKPGLVNAINNFSTVVIPLTAPEIMRYYSFISQLRASKYKGSVEAIEGVKKIFGKS